MELSCFSVFFPLKNINRYFFLRVLHSITTSRHEMLFRAYNHYAEQGNMLCELYPKHIKRNIRLRRDKSPNSYAETDEAIMLDCWFRDICKRDRNPMNSHRKIQLITAKSVILDDR